MTNYYYTEEVSRCIYDELNEHLPHDLVHSIHQCDFAMLANPETLSDQVPCVVVESLDALHEWANYSLGILYSRYKVCILYAYPYTYQKPNEQETKQARQVVDLISSILNKLNPLENRAVVLRHDELDTGGVIHFVNVVSSGLESGATHLFSDLDLPVAVGVVNVEIDFRTLGRGHYDKSNS
ncbi:MAG: hypothetical protein ATN35_02025 [Epulopiscium sp. Nele67-Bin004]|nr:MAG: hypothetical protein ATN35_02025 [Epulopiscium sp. Nele67-Bin004]